MHVKNYLPLFVFISTNIRSIKPITDIKSYETKLKIIAIVNCKIFSKNTNKNI